MQIINVELKNEISSLAQLIINSYSLNILEISDVSDNKSFDDSITLKLVSKNILTDEAIFQNLNLADMMRVIRVERANNLTFSSSDDLMQDFKVLYSSRNPSWTLQSEHWSLLMVFWKKSRFPDVETHVSVGTTTRRSPHRIHAARM